MGEGHGAMSAQRLIHLSFHIPTQAEQPGGRSADTKVSDHQNSLMDNPGRDAEASEGVRVGSRGPPTRRRRQCFWVTRIVEPIGLVPERVHS